MAVLTDRNRLPALRVQDRRELGERLEATLVELVDLSLLGRQLRWSVIGPSFGVLHERLDALVENWSELADALAERAVSIGYWPDAQAEAILASPDHATVARGPLEDRAVILLLTQSIGELAARTRARLGSLGELDPVSQDVMVTVLGELERQLWTSRAQLSLGE